MCVEARIGIRVVAVAGCAAKVGLSTNARSGGQYWSVITVDMHKVPLHSVRIPIFPASASELNCAHYYAAPSDVIWHKRRKVCWFGSASLQTSAQGLCWH